MGKYNLLIVEDHALTRFGLKTAFTGATNYGKILEAPNAQKAIEIINKQPIDVIIMDLGLPDMNGIEATKVIKQKHSKISIVILSSHEQEEDVIKSLRAGANAYCTKDVAPEKLIDIVDSVLKGAAWFDPKVAKYVLNAAINNTVVEETKPIAKPVKTKINQTPKAESNLTTREKEVLKLIAEGHSNIEISKELNMSVNTAKVHVCNILQKLSVSDRTQAAIKAIKDNII